MITPESFDDAQSAIIRGVNPAQIMRLLYNIQPQHGRKGKRLYQLSSTNPTPTDEQTTGGWQNRPRHE